MRRLIVVFIAMVFVAGCANTFDHQRALMAQMEQQKQEENSKNRKLCTMRFSEVIDSIQILRDKILLNAREDAPANLLANNSYPNEQEKQALLLFGDALEYCAKLSQSYFQKYFNSEYISVAVQSLNIGKNDFLDLYEGRITYGEYNKRRLSLASYQDGKISELDAKYREIARQEQLQAQQLQMQRSAILLDYSARMLQPNPAYVPQPMHIQCQNMGVYTNCTRW